MSSLPVFSREVRLKSRPAGLPLAGQIARALGASRVIGGTISADKAKRLTGELGYDAVVLRGARESHVLIAGLQNGPQAIQNIAAGKYFGTVLIRH